MFLLSNLNNLNNRQQQHLTSVENIFKNIHWIFNSAIFLSMQFPLDSNAYINVKYMLLEIILSWIFWGANTDTHLINHIRITMVDLQRMSSQGLTHGWRWGVLSGSSFISCFTVDGNNNHAFSIFFSCTIFSVHSSAYSYISQMQACTNPS